MEAEVAKLQKFLRTIVTFIDAVYVGGSKPTREMASIRLMVDAELQTSQRRMADAVRQQS